MVRWKGLEPLAYWFVASHSIQLSYQRLSCAFQRGVLHTVHAAQAQIT